MHYLKYQLGGIFAKYKSADGRLTDCEVCELDSRSDYECDYVESRIRHLPSANPRHQLQRYLHRRYPPARGSHKLRSEDLSHYYYSSFVADRLQ